MKKIFYLQFFLVAFVGCSNNENGLYGHSETRAEAKANGSNVLEYIPNKKKFELLDGTSMQIDTAWTEVSFTYMDGKNIIDSADGYNFTVPFKIRNTKSFTFTFSLADTTNRMFGNGRGDNDCQLRPIHLYDTMKVLLKQKNPDTSFGWMKPIITDTIIFTKIK